MLNILRTKIIIISIFCLFGIAWTTSNLLAVMNSTHYEIWADAVSVGGGEDQASANYKLQDTVGESAIGRSTSTNYSARIGFREMELNSSATPALILTLGAGNVNFGTLTKNGPNVTPSHTLITGTNSATGLSITFSGSPLTCPSCASNSNIGSTVSTPFTASAGTNQFGLSAIFQSAISNPAASLYPYNNANQFAFDSSLPLISSSGATGLSTFILKYVANVNGTESPGDYVTTLTFTATANF
ncbi:MAG: hypothetical protein WCP18_01350 [bacterium]